MSSITAMFLFNGFNSYLEKCDEIKVEAINFKFSDGGHAETARLLQSIASAADIFVEGRQGDFPGVWEYEVVEPFGSELASWAATGEVKTLYGMVEALMTRTDAWIAEIAPANQAAEYSAPQTSNLPEGRDSVIAITSSTKAGRGIHFTCHPLLSGSNSNLWFPVAPDESWFAAVERIMIMNGVAENVTDIQPLRGNANYTDYKVIFNRRIV